MAQPMLPALPGAIGEPRFARDEMGRVIKFVPSPRPGEGFIRVEAARQLGLRPTRPFYRFDRLQGLFIKIRPRRMNPLNFKALKRAQRREDAALSEVKKLFSRAARKKTSSVRTRRKTRKK